MKHWANAGCGLEWLEGKVRHWDYCHLGLAKGLQELLKNGPLP